MRKPQEYILSTNGWCSLGLFKKEAESCVSAVSLTMNQCRCTVRSHSVACNKEFRLRRCHNRGAVGVKKFKRRRSFFDAFPSDHERFRQQASGAAVLATRSRSMCPPPHGMGGNSSCEADEIIVNHRG